MGEGALNNVLARLSEDLNQNGIDYMVIGAVALMAHGYPRFTEDIDLVLTPEGLQVFHEKLVGLGYLPAFEGQACRRVTLNDAHVAAKLASSPTRPGTLCAAIPPSKNSARKTRNNFTRFPPRLPGS